MLHAHTRTGENEPQTPHREGGEQEQQTAEQMSKSRWYSENMANIQELRTVLAARYVKSLNPFLKQRLITAGHVRRASGLRWDGICFNRSGETFTDLSRSSGGNLGQRGTKAQVFRLQDLHHTETFFF